MKQLQERVAQFTKENGLEADVAHRLLDAMAELGEVAKEVLKGARYGKQGFVRTGGFEGELGDVLFSLLCVANAAGVDGEAAVEAALAKYAGRIATRGSPGSAAEEN